MDILINRIVFAKHILSLKNVLRYVPKIIRNFVSINNINKLHSLNYRTLIFISREYSSTFLSEIMLLSIECGNNEIKQYSSVRSLTSRDLSNYSLMLRHTVRHSKGSAFVLRKHTNELSYE